MKSRWLARTGYAIALLLQAVVLVGAYEVERLSREKMMVMRYLTAKNLEMEQTWFSPVSVQWQAVGLLVATAACVLLLALALRRHAWLPAAYALLGTVVAGVGVRLAAYVSADQMVALYAVIAAIWAVLAIEFVAAVGIVASRRLWTSSRRVPM